MTPLLPVVMSLAFVRKVEIDFGLLVAPQAWKEGHLLPPRGNPSMLYHNIGGFVLMRLESILSSRVSRPWPLLSRWVSEILGF